MKFKITKTIRGKEDIVFIVSNPKKIKFPDTIGSDKVELIY